MGEKPTATDENLARRETSSPSGAEEAERGPVRLDPTPARAFSEPGTAEHVYQHNETDLDFLQKKQDEAPPKDK